MLELFTIFTEGGICLFKYQGNVSMSGDPINHFVQTVLIETRATDEVFTVNNYCVQHVLDSARSLVFAAVYRKALANQVGYVPQLLRDVKADFVKQFKDDLSMPCVGKEFDYEDRFRAGLQKVMAKAEGQQTDMRSFSESDKFLKSVQGNDMSAQRHKELKQQKAADRAKKAQEQEAVAESEEETDEQEAVSPTSPQPKLTGKALLEYRQRMRAEKEAKKKAPTPSATPKRTSRISQKEKPGYQQIDFSVGKPSQSDAGAVSTQEAAAARDAAERIRTAGVESVTWDSEPEDDEEGGSSGGSGLFSYFKTLSASKLTKDALAPVLEQMRTHLTSKNIAVNISDKLCEAVEQRLVGTEKPSFTRTKTVVKQCLEETLTHLLTPKRNLDILRDIQQTQARGETYSIVFCGVNGVGKSTNLSKIAFWLMSNNLRVLIAACDTFRAGAVEQLQTHCTKLRKLLQDTNDASPRLCVFDKGYDKDAAGVASQALGFAKKEGYDVVLVDTAGRMQDNEPLMRSLTKLIKYNNPNLVLFVGEALVGTEAVDQLTKFNKALEDYSEDVSPHVIDGIILTKFDTVDDKVGSSVSMTYITGQPIVFVGTGQTYYDLKKLDVKSVVKALLV
eukprot:m.18616 g.18616  ORF g.18616 m.18616 type:complete len:619 (+) comp7919_c0_seq1:180-2036(+)